jgi:hypothetical protein
MKRLSNGKVVDYNPWEAEKLTVADAVEAGVVDVVPDGSIAEVLDWVGDDPDRATLALEAELAKESPRSTLVDKLS